MQVKVLFVGLTRHYIGEREKDLEMPEGSRIGDLLTSVGRQYGSRLPGHFWDEERMRFHPGIKAIRKGSAAVEEDEMLCDEDEIYFITRMAGG